MPEQSTTRHRKVLDRDRAAAFVDSYGRTWESWDVESFAALFSDGVVYVAHPQEAIVGKSALSAYFLKEKAEQGSVSVRMGEPVIDRGRVAAEFWVTATNGSEEAAFTGCFIARLDETSGLCTYFREYWFDLDGHVEAYAGWGE